MLARKFFLIVIICFLLPAICAAQQARGTTVTNNSAASHTGDAYALIIGINYTGRKNFTQLHYAVDDAGLVKQFLQSGIFFDSIPDDNIKIITDKEATAIQLWYGFEWLLKKAKRNDQAIIYFAGHGIASGPALGFLIAYDAPDVNDPSQFGFQGGAIPVYQLKTDMEELRNNGVTTYLITDACRNNEKRDSSQLNFPDVLEMNEGELQFSSCSRNQSSMEDQKWGGGHGLFTYYLIKGLSGYADDEADGTKDGKVTLEELKAYVEKHVRNDSRNLITNQVQQMPYINISAADNQEAVIAYVKPDKTIYRELKENNLVASVKRGLDKDTSELYRQFEEALNNNRFFSGEPGNAYNILMNIKASHSSIEYDDAAQEYVIHLINDAQIRINKYFEGLDTNYTLQYFGRGAKELNTALGFMSKAHPLYKVYTINRLFLEARSMMGNYNDHDLALSKIDSALSLDSSVAYLYHVKGLLYSDVRQWKEAIPFFERARQLKQDWIMPKLGIANCYDGLHMFEKEKEFWLGQIKMDSANKDYWNDLGNLFNNQRQYDSAIICYHKSLAIDSDYLYPLRNLGDVYQTIHQDEKARKSYQKAILIDSLSPVNWNNYGLLWFSEHRYDNAIDCYNHAIRIDPFYLYSLRNLGDAYNAINQRDKAKEFYYRAVRAESLNSDSWNSLGYFYYNEKNYDSAVICYNNAVAIDPDYYYSLRNLGDVYSVLHQTERARESYWQAIKVDSLEPGNWNSLGYFYYKQKNYDSAIICYNQALAIDPRYSYSLRNTGDVYQSIHQNKKAREYYFSAIEADSFSSDGWNLLGNFYYNQKNYDSAIICYEKALAIDSGYSYSLRNLGNVYTTIHKDDKAKEYYLRTIQSDPLSKEAWLQFGNLFYLQKQYDSAKRCYEKAVAIDPQYADAYNNLGNIFNDKNQNDSAIWYYKKAIGCDTNYTLAFNNVGAVFYGQRQYDSAELYYQKAIVSDPNYTNAYFNLGNLFTRKEQYDSAKWYFLKTVSLDSTNAAAFLDLAKIFLSKTQYDSAEIFYKKLLDLDSSNAEGLNGVSLCTLVYLKTQEGEIFLNRILKLKLANTVTFKICKLYSNVFIQHKQYDSTIELLNTLLVYDSLYHIPDVDSSDRIVVLDNFAYACLNTGDLSKSKYYYEKEGAMYNYYYNLACLASLDHKVNDALHNLELSFQNGFKDYDHILQDTDLDNIRNADAFKNLLKKYFPDK